MKMINKIRKAYSQILVRNLWVHWFNPLYTLYINFVFLPFRQAIRFPIFIYGWPRLYSQYGTMECRDVCQTGMVKINHSIPGSPQCAVGNTELNIQGKVMFHGKCMIGSGTKIIVDPNGLLDIGYGCFIANLCNITANRRVVFGARSRIAHRAQVMDSNFHYILDFNKNAVRAISKPIHIGAYCWICNSSSVLGGTILPDKTIVASNSMVNKDMSAIPEESIIGGVPAKLISSGFRRVFNERLHKELWKYFTANPDSTSFVFETEVDSSICDSER